MRGKKVLVLIIISCIIFSIWKNQKDIDYNRQVLEAGYTNLNRLKKYENEDILRVYENEEGEIVQIVSSEGYNGRIVFLTGIKDAMINNVKILEQSESHDYGGYVEKEWFLERLYLPIDRKFKVVKMINKESNEVVSITGATITTNGIVDGINKCIENYRRIKNEK